ncbi:hypothetical protein [Nocardioides alkalitolerans]|uniref:hypothetical protein n=1 Tax=Nocardioides alkalitolerans TaxID=281714 RepID=UPI0003FFF978|nr:hypothetical protein [Nocardioides alkalitolerans]
MSDDIRNSAASRASGSGLKPLPSIATAFRTRWLVIVIGLAIGLVVGLVAANASEPRYSATTTVRVGSGLVPVGDFRPDTLWADDQVAFAGTRPVQEAIAEEIGDGVSADDVAENLTVMAEANSNFLLFSWTDGTPVAAESRADAAAEVYLVEARTEAEDRWAEHDQLLENLIAAYDPADQRAIDLQAERVALEETVVDAGKIAGDADTTAQRTSLSPVVSAVAGGLAGLLLGAAAAYLLHVRRPRGDDDLDEVHGYGELDAAGHSRAQAYVPAGEYPVSYAYAGGGVATARVGGTTVLERWNGPYVDVDGRLHGYDDGYDDGFDDARDVHGVPGEPAEWSTEELADADASSEGRDDEVLEPDDVVEAYASGDDQPAEPFERPYEMPFEPRPTPETAGGATGELPPLPSRPTRTGPRRRTPGDGFRLVGLATPETGPRVVGPVHAGPPAAMTGVPGALPVVADIVDTDDEAALAGIGLSVSPWLLTMEADDPGAELRLGVYVTPDLDASSVDLVRRGLRAVGAAGRLEIVLVDITVPTWRIDFEACDAIVLVAGATGWAENAMRVARLHVDAADVPALGVVRVHVD